MSDYIGFTYNGVHSSDLGIVRVSNGSRFDENLLPTVQDKTVPVPGGDGTYYFGSYYTQRQFNIPFAFDALTELQFEKLRAHFGDKGIHDLVFDEKPYKIYSAKVTGTASIKYIPFDDATNGRIYKGEGSIQFTCYQPFARCEIKYLDQYLDSDYPNKNEWADTSGLLQTQGNFDKQLKGDQKVWLYNPGVKEADWIITIKPWPNGNQNELGSFTLKLNEQSLAVSKVLFKDKNGFKDQAITINSKTNLIEGWRKEGENYIKSGNLYNELILGGEFFKIPVDTSEQLYLEVIRQTSEDLTINYNYYYF